MNSSQSTTAPIRTEVVGALGEYAQDWDRLVEEMELPSPFLKSWWLENSATGPLQIICVSRNGSLIGGAAFESRPWGPSLLGLEKVTVVGDGLLAPDHIDLVASPDDRRLVSRAVLRWLLRKGSRLLDLNGLAAEGALAGLFSDCERSRYAAPFAELPRATGEFLAGRPGRVRSTIKRRSKAFDAMDAKWSAAEPTDLDRALADFSKLHDLRWSEQSGFLDATERFEAVIRDGIASGDVVLNELRLPSGETIAVEIDFEVGGRISFYQSGRRTDHEWRGCGTVLRSRIIEDGITRGMHEYDMLRGEEAYKTEWATSERSLSDHRMAVGARARAALGLLALRARLNLGSSPSRP